LRLQRGLDAAGEYLERARRVGQELGAEVRELCAATTSRASDEQRPADGALEGTNAFADGGLGDVEVWAARLNERSRTMRSNARNWPVSICIGISDLQHSQHRLGRTTWVV
jgi:hypothetical protein